VSAKLVTPAIALIWLSVFLSVSALAQAPDLPVINGGIYVMRPLVNVALCLEVRGAAATSGSLAGTWDFLEMNHQRWRFLDAGSGFWHLEPVNAPGQRLEVAGGTVTNGMPLRIANASSSPQQKWLVLHQGGGAYRLVPLINAGGCLAVQDAMTSRGARVQFWQTSSSAIYQLWKIECETPVLDNAVYHFHLGTATNLALEVPGPNLSSGAPTRLGRFQGAFNQKWLFVDEGFGWWSLAPSTAPSLRLEVPGGTNAAGAQPGLAGRSEASSQKWRFHNLGGDQFILQPQSAPGLGLAVSAGSPTNLAPVLLQSVTNVSGANWTFVRDGNTGSPAVLANYVQILSGVYRTPIDVVRTNFLLWLDRDRVLYPYYRHGGVSYDRAKTNYGGWFGDGALDVAGMWLSAAARSYVQGGPETNQLKVNIDYLVTKMAQVQDPVTGRLIWPPTSEMQSFQNGAFYATNPPTAGSYWYLVFPGQRNHQMQWYWWEKILGGLLDAYRYAGNAQALTVATRNAGYVLPFLQTMPANKCQEMLKVDSGNLAEHFALLGQITARADFQVLARKLTMETNVQAYAGGLNTAVGQHGNTTVPRFTGAARVFQFCPENYLRDGADNFFTKMVRDHCYAYGGLTDWEDISAGEPLGTINTEGCVTHQMCRLARNLSETGMKIDYAEYIENATLNQLVGEYDENGSSTYYNSCLPGHMKLYGSRDKSFWCCTQRGWDDASRHAEYIYSAGGDTLWVNLFVDSRVRWWQEGLAICQNTKFPIENTSLLTIESGGPKELSLKIRIPRWVRGEAVVQINSESASTFRPGEWAHLRRVWTQGDKVAVTLPMGLRLRASRNANNQVTFFYGPVMLAADLGPISIDDHLQGDPRAIPTPTKTVPMLAASTFDPERVLAAVPGQPLTFVTRPGVLRGGNYTRVTLRPYYSIVHRHHNIYWDLQSSAGVISNGVYKVLRDTGARPWRLPRQAPGMAPTCNIGPTPAEQISTEGQDRVHTPHRDTGGWNSGVFSIGGKVVVRGHSSRRALQWHSSVWISEFRRQLHPRHTTVTFL